MPRFQSTAPIPLLNPISRPPLSSMTAKAILSLRTQYALLPVQQELIAHDNGALEASQGIRL